jgi:peptidoglycan/LPS O-acetylase OafA/YrhL
MTMRCIYLDYFRAFCMLFIVPLHAFYMLDYAPAALFAVLTYNFCMSAFFLISGYVMAASLVTKSVSDILSSRIMALGVPFIVGLLIINPVTLAIMFGGFGSAEYWAELQARFADRSIIVHLWFLVTLISFVIITPLLAVTIRSGLWRWVIAGCATHLPARYWPVAIVLSAGLLRTIMELMFKDITPRPFDNIPEYFWAYAFGFALFAHPQGWRRIHSIDPMAFILAASLWIVVITGTFAPGTWLELAVYNARLAVSSAAITFGLLWLFRKTINRPNAVWSFLSEAAFSVYILQWLVLFALRPWLEFVGLSAGGLFWSAVFGTLTITLVLHHLVIKRVPILMLILNGKWPEQRPQPRTQPRAS